MMKKLIKKHFTLLELMVTLVLIILCFSIIATKVNQAVYVHKCKNNIKKIDMYFDFCQKMSFSNQSDIYLKLSQKNLRICCEIGTDEHLGILKNYPKNKDFFDDMFFLFNQKQIDSLEILFSSTGNIVPKGCIEFSDKTKKFKQSKSI